MRKIFIVMDYVCNSACISCAKKSEERGCLTLDQIIDILDTIEPAEEDYIELSGGEPTLRTDILNICETIKLRYNTNLILLSNGRMFKDKQFAERIVGTGVSRVMSTFYSPHESKHDGITQRTGSFSDTVKGLTNLEELGCSISVKTIVIQQNYKDLAEFVKFAYDTFPSAWVSIHGLIMRGHAYDNREKIVIRYKKMKPYVEEAIEEAIKRERNLGVFVIPSCVLDPAYWRYLSVDWKKITKEMIYISPEETVIGNLDVDQPGYCKDCLINENCSWAWESAWREYISMFGTDELDKVLSSRLVFDV